jgi:AcrR family transcriptional regulator
MTMSPRRQPVKASRPYDAPERRERAARTRGAVLDAAERLFLDGGYAATSIASIARRAGVSPETIYKTFGSKPALLAALRDRALLGAGPGPAEDRSDAARAEASDGAELIQRWAQLATEVAPRVAPIMLVVRAAAATDADLGELWHQTEAARHRRMTANAAAFAARGFLRRGVTVAEAADILFTYSSAEVYDILVLRRGWSVRRYRDFIATGMTAALT